MSTATTPKSVAPKVSFLSANSFSRILEERNPALSACLLDMQERALNSWLSLLVPDQGSHSGLLHLFNVGRNVDKMIPDSKKDKLSTGEIFLLLATVLLHDIGRTVPGEVKHPGLNFCKKRPHDCTPGKNGKTKCQQDHWDHNLKSREIINKAGFELGLPDFMAMEYCGLLAYCHKLAQPPRVKQPVFPDLPCCSLKAKAEKRFRNTSIEPLGAIRIPMLAAILRIADETENHWTRVCQDRWSKLLSTSRENRFKAFRERVEDVVYSHAGECIIMHLNSMPEGNKAKEPFARMTKEIEAVLSSWASELSPIGVSFNKVFYEVEGRLCKIEWKGRTAHAIVKPMHEVFKRDFEEIKLLARALVSLSKSTLGHPEFPWTSLEAEVGRPLKERDKWLVEQLDTWFPKALQFDHNREVIIVNPDEIDGIKSL
jgi:hypothetical protein